MIRSVFSQAVVGRQEIERALPLLKTARNILSRAEELAMQCLMDHIVINVEDDEKMMAFYSTVLMIEAERFEEYRKGEVPFPSVRLNADTIIDLFPKKLWEKKARAGEGRENLNHFCISLPKSDWDALRSRLENNGVAVEEGPVRRWGAHGTGTSIYFRDPEHNFIEARYYDNLDGS